MTLHLDKLTKHMEDKFVPYVNPIDYKTRIDKADEVKRSGKACRS